MSSFESYLPGLKNRYRRLRIAETALLVLGIALAVFALAGSFGWQALPSVLFAGIAAVTAFVIRYRQLGIHRLNEQQIATYLNRQFPNLQDSTDLLAMDTSTLGPLQQLQQQRLFGQLKTAAQEVKWPQSWRFAIISLGLGLLLCLFVQQDLFRDNTIRHLSTLPVADTLSGTVEGHQAIVFEEASILVQPPAYTGLRAKRSKDFNIQAPEGSQASWQIQFSASPEKVYLLFSDGDSSSLQLKNGRYDYRKTLDQSGFYQLNWLDGELLKSSDYFKLEVIPDQVPRAAITNQEQFTELPWDKTAALQVKASLTDDYGLSDAYVIATVTKGNGESVKFREEKLSFLQPARISGKQLQAGLELNTAKLGMEPGDELYYYVEVWDNRMPRPQSSRTETYFVQLQDTTSQVISFEGGLGVDLMPEYFRSQRQIIIDSEKLLAERAGINKKDFNARSNELGYDQKVLRLRYGQFLGEEFESGITSESHEEEHDEAAPETEEEAAKQYGHTHDSENEHNLVAEPAHQHKGGEESDAESPIEAFAHTHDNTEEATFFIQSVKVKLRAALNLMWDAELHLRMFDPAASLPYQYKILKLLKEISNDSRIYVHRTGFDPPPLKEEKRLSGELKEVQNSRVTYLAADTEPFPAIRKALPVLERLLQEGKNGWQSQDLPLLTAAGNELAAAAIEQPDRYLASLSALKSLLDGELRPERLQLVRAACWSLLPPAPPSAAGIKNGDHPLQDAFIDQLQDQAFR